jgi:FtsP/CotA-like multicopper oxidase with cupredoxin domain
MGLVCIALQGILINNQFPGPQIEAVTNDNLIINVFNKLNEPFLLSWYVPPHHSLCSSLGLGCDRLRSSSKGFFLSATWHWHPQQFGHAFRSRERCINESGIYHFCALITTID